MGQGTQKEIPAFDTSKPYTPVEHKEYAPPFDPNKPFTPVKKKEPDGTTYSGLGLTGAKATFSNNVPVPTPEEVKAGLTKGLTTADGYTEKFAPKSNSADPVGDFDVEIENKTKDTERQFYNPKLSPRLNEQVSHEKVDLGDLHDAKESFIQSIFPTTNAARQYLYADGKVENPNSKTDQAAKQIIDRHESVKQKLLESGGDLNKAAIDIYSEDNPQLKLLKDKGQPPPPLVQQQLLYNLLQDKDVKELTRESPEINNAYQAQANNFFEKNPELRGKNILSKIAQAREDYGFNNPYLNFMSAKGADKAVEAMVVRGDMTEADKDFYYKELRPFVKLGIAKVPTPGIVETTIQSAGKGLEDIPKGIYEATGLRNLATSKADRAYQSMEEDADQIGFNPKGINKISNATGNLAGVLLPMAAGAEGLQAFKLLSSPEKANKLMLGIQFYHGLQKEAEKNNPNDPIGNHITALTQSLVFMNLNRVLPGLSAKVFNEVKPVIGDALEKLRSDEITGAAAKSTIINTVLDKAKEVAGTTLKGSSEMALATYLNKGIEGVFTGKFNSDEALNEAAHTFESMALGLPLISMATSKGGQRNVAGDILMEMTVNPETTEHFKEQIRATSAKDPEFAKTAPQLIANLNHAVEIRKQLDSRDDLSDNQKRDFMLAEMQQKVLQNKVDNAPSKILAKPEQEKIKELEEEKKNIIDPKSPENVIIEQANKGALSGYSDLVKQDPSKAKDVLLDYAKQKYGISDNGSEVEGGGREITNKEVDAAVSEAFQNKNSVIQAMSEKADEQPVFSEQQNNESQNPVNSQNETTVLSNRLSPEEKQGAIAGGQRNVEATNIAEGVHRSSGEGSGIDKELSQDEIREKQSDELKKYAQENNIWVEDPYKEFGDKPDAKGAEQIVYKNKDGNTVTKINSGSVHGDWREFFERIAVHNQLFPDTKYTLKGFTDLSGDVSAVLEQPLIKADRGATKQEITDDMAESGFEPTEQIDGNTGNDYYNPKTGVYVRDLHGQNVLVGKDGNLFYIDPIIELDTPDKGYGGTRKEFQNEQTDNKEIPTEDNQSQSSEKTVDATGEPTETGEGAGEGGKPPKIEEPVETEGEKDKTGGITHAATEETTNKAGLPPYEGHEPVTHLERIEKAKADLKENPNLHNEIMEKVEKGGNVTPQDNAVLAVYKASLDKELEENPSKELYDKISRVAKVLNPEGTFAGQLLESRKLYDDNPDSLSNFLMGKEAAQEAPLTDKQVKSETAKYTELKAAKEALEKELAAEKEKYTKLAAEIGVNKAKAAARKASKKTHEQHVEDRKAIVEKARKALKDIREGGLQSTIPGIRELKALAPHIKSYMQDLLNEGVDKFDNIVSAIHAEFKDVLDGLKKTDVIDILAGEHDEKKEKTRNEKANQLRLIKREAQLTKELGDARKGLEKIKDEKTETATNRRIEELKTQIKEVRRLNKERNEIDDTDPFEFSEDEVKNQELEKRLEEKAKKLEDDIKNKNYLEEKEKPPVFKKSQKAQKLEDRVIDLENKIRHERSADEYNKRGKWRKAFDKVMEVLGIRRLVQSAVDISVPFRQGATLISPRRVSIWAKGFQANLKSVFNPKKFERIMYSIRHDPQYHDMVKDRIVFNDLGSADPNLHNEDFRKSFIYNVPVLSEPLKASNRSADAFLNVARYEMYKKMRANLEKKGLTRESDPEAFKKIGNWVMNMTGRGRMTNALENNVGHTIMGNTFYGARLMSSRFNLLNPLTYFDTRIPKEVRYEAMKDLASFTVTTMASAMALAAAGGKISLNPDDSDFLQVRFGDKVYDLSGGLVSYVRTFLRMAKAGVTKATGTSYEGNKATDKAGNSVLQFFRNKLSPNTAYAADAFFGKAYGQKFDPYDIVKIYPMYADDVMKALKEEGPMAIPTVLIPNILGIGYGSYASKGQIDANVEDLLKRNLRSSEMDIEKIKNYKQGGRLINDKEFNEFADERDAAIEKDIKILFEKGVNGTPYKDLTKEQVAAETSYIKANATRETKEKLFGKHKETSKEKKESEKLSQERAKKYKTN